MSYEANVNGFINLLEPVDIVLKKLKRKNNKYEKYSDLEKLIQEEFNIDVEVNIFKNDPNAKINEEVNEVKDYIDFYAYTKYNEDNYYDLLNMLMPYVAQPAEIFFKGENDALWKLKISNNELCEYAGEIQYDDEKINLRDVQMFLIDTDTNNYMQPKGTIDEIREKHLDDFLKEVEKTKRYWTPKKIQHLLLSIALSNYAYKCENESDEKNNYPSLSYDAAVDYVQSVINKQTLQK